MQSSCYTSPSSPSLLTSLLLYDLWVIINLSCILLLSLPSIINPKNPALATALLQFDTNPPLFSPFTSSYSCSQNFKPFFLTYILQNTQQGIAQEIHSNKIRRKKKEDKAMNMYLSPHFLGLLLLFIFQGVSGTTFTFRNNCQYRVWPGILSSAGHPNLESTGFELPHSASRSFEAPEGWSGRFWGRTGCNFDASGQGSCATGDCGSGQVECNGAGANPPATLAEFTLGSGDTNPDFYDVSLVDGYNLPMVVITRHGVSGTCAVTGCIVDLNQRCPTELKVAGGDACRSACDAFGKPEFCCSGEYSNPNTCRPSAYSEVFKTACPRSYSYAYDDATSTFTCSGADYEITFCPALASQKSSRTGGAGVMLADDSYLVDSDTAKAMRVSSFGHRNAFIFFIIMMALLLL